MRTFIFLSLISLLTGSGRATPPEWFVSGSHKRYPVELYIVGVGSGPSYEAAMDAGSAQILRQIEVSLSSEVQMIISSVAIDDRESITEEFQAANHSVAEGSLRGVEAVEKASVSGEFYVMMALDKAKYAEGLQAELKAKVEALKSQYADAEALLDKGTVFPALDVYLKTAAAAAEFTSEAALFAYLTGEPMDSHLRGNEEAGGMDGIATLPELVSRSRGIIADIELETVSGDGQSARRGGLLPEALTVRATWRGKPMADVGLIIRDADGKTVGKAATNASGEAGFWIHAQGEERGMATVAFVLGAVPAMLARDVKRLEAQFIHTITPVPPMRFALDIHDQTGRRDADLEAAVARVIQRAGHTVEEGAPFKLAGRVATLESHEVNGAGGREYLVKCELPLELTYGSSGQRLASVTASGNGLDKSSVDAALRKAGKNLKLSPEHFARMLVSAEDKLKPINVELSAKALAAGKTCLTDGRKAEAWKYLSQVTEGESQVAEAEKLIQSLNSTSNP